MHRFQFGDLKSTAFRTINVKIVRNKVHPARVKYEYFCIIKSSDNIKSIRRRFKNSRTFLQMGQIDSFYFLNVKCIKQEKRFLG